MVLEDILRRDIIGDYFTWRMVLQLKLNDINVRNVEGNSKLNSQNTGVNSAITPIK